MMPRHEKGRDCIGFSSNLQEIFLFTILRCDANMKSLASFKRKLSALIWKYLGKSYISLTKKNFATIHELRMTRYLVISVVACPANLFFLQLCRKLRMTRYFVMETLAFPADDEISRHEIFLFL